jgi:hypothetical protein
MVVAQTKVFAVLGHTLSLQCVIEGRWSVIVDGVSLPGTFGTQVEAWEAGVRAVETQRQGSAALEG